MRRWALCGVGCGALALLAFAACGLGEQGLLADGGSKDVQVVDVVDACAPCSAELASGWTLALLGTGSCPSGLSQQTVVSAPVVGAGACTCACDAPPGQCTSGNLTLGYGSNCGQSELYAVTGNCQTITGGTPIAGQYSVLAAPTTGAACAARTVVDDAGVSVTAQTLCVPPATCDESLCGGSAPSGFTACVVQSGDQPCPPGPFSNKTVIGADWQLNCAGCACSPPQIQCAGTLTYFTDGLCNLAQNTLTLGGGCTTADGGPVFSYKWSGSYLDAGCSPVGQPDASGDFTQKRTVCCR